MSSLPPSVSNATAHFPWSLEFFVEDRKNLLRDPAKIRHVQELFSVQVTGLVQSREHEWMTVTLGSSSQELIEKAKVC